MNCSRRELVLTSGQFLCEIISGVILAEIVKSNHSSTLGVATLGESIVFFSDVLAEVQIPRQSSPISITTPYSDFNVCTLPCHARQ